MKKTYQQKSVARFRQWTRKGYAAFSSLGRCVTIGQLRKSITERSLTKQASCGLTESTNSTSRRERTDEMVPDTIPPLQEVLLSALLSTQPLSTSTPPALPRTKDYHINCVIDAPNAFCSSLSHQREEPSKTHLVRLCVNTPYLTCV